MNDTDLVERMNEWRSWRVESKQLTKGKGMSQSSLFIPGLPLIFDSTEFKGAGRSRFKALMEI